MEDDEIIMTTPEFFTNEVFRSREELLKWVKDLARSLGVVIVTKRSNRYLSSGFVYKVVLTCDHGGKYKKKGSIRAPRTRKTDCPFELEARYSNECNIWRLTVICDEHNHRPIQNMEGHPYAQRLTQDEFSLVAELTMMNVAPLDILAIIKERNLSNVSTISTIYNARTKLRMVEQVGNSPMQVLMSTLHSNNYVYEFSTTGSNELENLFFVHPTSFDTWRAFPHVLIMDATYNTNLYKLPFVEIVGITSTNKTFSIAFAFIESEKTANYTWVLNCLKLTLDSCMHPRVIVTDRELALVNACKDVFPDAAHLLCRIHISRNIFERNRHTIKSKRDWCYFHALWGKLEKSATIDSYTENYNQLQSLLTNYPRVLKYINETWLDKYKEKFVSAWIDRHLNFGNNNTNRVESQHAVLKKYLKSTKSTLAKLVDCINRLVQSQHTAIKASFEKSRITRYEKHDLQCFKLLRGFVSNEALNIIVDNHRQQDSSDCDCRLRNSCGLPCSCEFSAYLNSGQCIPLDSIDIFWRRLDFSPATSVQDDDEDDDVSCERVLEQFRESYNQQPKVGKRSLLRKLKDFFNPGTTNIQEPQVKKNTRGRPKKSQQKKHPEFCSTRYSCSAMPDFVDSAKVPARHSCFEFDLNEVPNEFDQNEVPDEFDQNEVPVEFDLNEEPTRHSCFEFDLNGSNSMEFNLEVFQSNQPFFQDPFMSESQPQGPNQSYYPDPYMYTTHPYYADSVMSETPPYFVDPSMNNANYLTGQGLKNFLPYITQVKDVRGDGNCGFRATADCLDHHQENWRRIRSDLLDELVVHNETYKRIFHEEGVQPFQHMLNHFDNGFADTPYWMIMPDTGLLIASRYNVVVIFLSPHGDTTCLPLCTSPPRSQPHKICVIARFNGNHYVSLVFEGDFPIPPTHPQWSRYAFDRTWENPYLRRQNVYKQIKCPKRNSVGVKTVINVDG